MNYAEVKGIKFAITDLKERLDTLEKVKNSHVIACFSSNI